MDTIKLTQYSHGAGCGCKISPKVLDTILKSQLPTINDKNLLVGNASKDDAAAYDIGNNQAIISTTDFFMPIVDDPFDFGRIAATNAISDVYAMGGKPIMAIAILGWPINKLSPEVAQIVVDGGRAVCNDAGIILAGGHSIDSPEPIFGLAVTGIANIENLKQNNTATVGCNLYLTKPLGVGILSTAQKKACLRKEDELVARDFMVKLNDIGFELSKIKGIKAMTDVTGFGLLGHLSEICEGSSVTARLNFDAVPKINIIDYYLDLKCIPGGTISNWGSYGHKISKISDYQRNILCDPQTSGGLLIAVEPDADSEVLEICSKFGYTLESIGKLEEKAGDKFIIVE